VLEKEENEGTKVCVVLEKEFRVLSLVGCTITIWRRGGSRSTRRKPRTTCSVDASCQSENFLPLLWFEPLHYRRHTQEWANRAVWCWKKRRLRKLRPLWGFEALGKWRARLASSLGVCKAICRPWRQGRCKLAATATILAHHLLTYCPSAVSPQTGRTRQFHRKSNGFFMTTPGARRTALWYEIDDVGPFIWYIDCVIRLVTLHHVTEHVIQGPVIQVVNTSLSTKM
jgi:hypothetical protein